MNALSPIRMGDAAARPAPWGSEPGRLWSLQDMLGSYVWQFFLLSKFLESIRARLDMPPLSAPEFGSLGIKNSLLGISPGISAFAAETAVQSSSSVTISAEDRKTLEEVLSLLLTCCKHIGIINIESQLRRAILAAQTSPTKDILRVHVENISDRILDELGNEKFLHIPKEKAEHFANIAPFGETSAKISEDVLEDMTRAHTCYALGQNTACVFHLMRVMEKYVQRFGKKLKVNIDVKAENWHQIMEHVHKQIGALPGGKKATAAQNNRKQRFASAASRLDHVRIAWRNSVMHPKETYDEAEAFELLGGVRAFVVSVAGLV